MEREGSVEEASEEEDDFVREVEKKTQKRVERI